MAFVITLPWTSLYKWDYVFAHLLKWLGFLLILLVWCIASVNFLNVEPPLYSWDKPRLVIMCYHFVYCCT